MYVGYREKAVANIVNQMKERLSLKNLNDDQWELIHHYVMCAFIDGKDYAVSKYVLKENIE